MQEDANSAALFHISPSGGQISCTEEPGDRRTEGPVANAACKCRYHLDAGEGHFLVPLLPCCRRSFDDSFVEPLYRDQTAVVDAGKSSQPFTLGRRVKQGDPISALLLIPVMEVCFMTPKERLNMLKARTIGKCVQ